MKRLILVLIITTVCVWYGVRAVDTVQACMFQRDAALSEVFRK